MMNKSIAPVVTPATHPGVAARTSSNSAADDEAGVSFSSLMKPAGLMPPRRRIPPGRRLMQKLQRSQPRSRRQPRRRERRPMHRKSHYRLKDYRLKCGPAP